MADETDTFKDALHVTRNLHRLVITISLITLVFSLSLRLPERVQMHHEAIRSFIEFDFAQYDRYATNRAEEAARDLLPPVVERIQAALAEYPLFAFPSVESAFESPILLGRFNVNETLLSTPAEVRLSRLDDLARVFGLDRDLLLVVAEPESILPQLHEFLQSHGQPFRSIQNLRLKTYEHYSIDNMPAHEAVIKLLLSFEIVAPGGPPSWVFDRTFNARVVRIPDSSFQCWLVNHHRGRDIAEVEDGALKWLPALADISREMAERPLGDVLGLLTDELQRGNPDGRSVSILGTEVPGGLLIYAAPLTLLVLTYYLLFHLRHLYRYAHHHKRAIERFAWLPLSLERRWVLEAAASITLVPLLSLVVMTLQVWRFGLLGMFSWCFMLTALVLVLLLSVKAIMQIRMLRVEIGR